MLNKELLMMGGEVTSGTLTLNYYAEDDGYIQLRNVLTGEIVFYAGVSGNMHTETIPVNIGDRLALGFPEFFIESVYDMVGLSFSTGIFTVLENHASVNIHLMLN